MNTKVTKIYLSSSFVDYWLEWPSGLRRYIPNRKDLSSVLVVRPASGTQPHYEAAVDLRVE